MSRSARSAWSFLSVIAFNVTSMGLALVVTPILLRELGPARLGASRAVMDWVGYLTLFELGLNGAIIPLLARALAQKDSERIRGTLAAGFRAYLLVLVPMVVGALLLVFSIPRLVKVEPQLHGELRAACTFAAVPLLLMPLAPLRALIDASQRGYALSALLIAQSLIVALASVALAKLGLGIAGQTLAVAIGAAALGAFVVTDAFRNARGSLPSTLARNPELSREIWSLNTPTLVITVCARIGLLTDNIVIGGILSAPLIVPFLMTQRLGQIVQGQLQAVGSASWAGLTELHSRGESVLFRERFLELNQLVVTLGLTLLMPIVAYNHTFVALWLGEASYGGLMLTAIAACNVLAIAVASLWGWLFGGTGQFARLVPISVASAAVNLAVSVGFTWFMSKRDPQSAMWGPVLGTASALYLVNVPLTPILMRRHFAIPVRALAKAIGAPFLIAAPFCAVLMRFAALRPPHGWLMLLVSMACAGASFAALCWVLLLNAVERGRWLHRLRLALGRGR